jgi:hypothetical protein
VEGGFERGEEGVGFRGIGWFEEEIDDASAAEAVRDLGGVVEEGGVGFEDGSVADLPLGLADELGLEAATGDGAGEVAIGGDEEVGSGTAVGGAFDANEGDEGAGVALLVKGGDLATLGEAHGLFDDIPVGLDVCVRRLNGSTSMGRIERIGFFDSGALHLR